MDLKSLITNGTSFHKEVDVEFDGQTITATIRPISQKEYDNIEAKMNKGQKRYLEGAKAKNQYLDLEDTTRRGNQFFVDVVLAGVVGDFTKESIESLPVGLVRKLSTEILIASGVGEYATAGSEEKNE